MIGLALRIEERLKRIGETAQKATFKNLGHAAAAIRKTAVESIVVAEGSSNPGTPPHTRRRQLNRAIRFDVDQQADTAVIGPLASVVGQSAAVHEWGGEFYGDEYPARPFMRPALEQNVERFAAEWAGSVGEA